MDELGRATSSSDGLAIAWSCCEYLLSLKAYPISFNSSPFKFIYLMGDQFEPELSSFRYTIFATHMEGLAELATMYPNVKVLHFEVEIKSNRLHFKVTFKLGYS